MASEAKNVGSAVNDSSGGVNAWVNPGNFAGNNSTSYADGACGSGGIELVLSCKLVKNGSRTGNTKSVYPSSKTVYSMGGTSDLWGVSLEPSDVNASNFGFSLQGEYGTTTQYLKATGMSFDIPSGATIDGIKVEVTADSTDLMGNKTIRCYLALVTVYYSESSGGTGKAIRTFAKVLGGI